MTPADAAGATWVDGAPRWRVSLPCSARDRRGSTPLLFLEAKRWAVRFRVGLDGLDEGLAGVGEGGAAAGDEA